MIQGWRRSAKVEPVLYPSLLERRVLQTALYCSTQTAHSSYSKKTMELKPQVPPTMDYLTKLNREGSKVIDVFLTKIKADMFRMQVYLADGTEKEFFLSASPEIMAHYREAIAFSGYGPRGFGNLIHADVMNQCRETGLPDNRFQVFVSQECKDHMGVFGEQWTIYGYEFKVSPAVSGMSYVIRQKEDPDSFKRVSEDFKRRA